MVVIVDYGNDPWKEAIERVIGPFATPTDAWTWARENGLVIPPRTNSPTTWDVHELVMSHNA
jgi:hypothetical protein